jgi:hypothetical protein
LGLWNSNPSLGFQSLIGLHSMKASASVQHQKQKLGPSISNTSLKFQKLIRLHSKKASVAVQNTKEKKLRSSI